MSKSDRVTEYSTVPKNESCVKWHKNHFGAQLPPGNSTKSDHIHPDCGNYNKRPRSGGRTTRLKTNPRQASTHWANFDHFFNFAVRLEGCFLFVFGLMYFFSDDTKTSFGIAFPEGN